MMKAGTSVDEMSLPVSAFPEGAEESAVAVAASLDPNLEPDRKVEGDNIAATRGEAIAETGERNAGERGTAMRSGATIEP